MTQRRSIKHLSRRIRKALEDMGKAMDGISLECCPLRQAATRHVYLGL